ncbi:hypothetical protein SMACR_02983 [Sordaria macrospora]|uniref:WGS project CABT00000000 data, contig 2.12 n=2 Tax=Sordaria macrospora TaxID=5147 RepID=F7VY18_SORMK|nr:uncharacterized protein SMAC_02983 [Sordaria macrospora k-hell]KAA8634600.1 hypothetical protein SMACR_02983 [Sordaria macrospora]WPJ58342.1 hypothetical protein SMAC4_02983 [Sordaria macrospora]CCC10412.1 unnamed protein product [Sordaria macrospora k-hell]
MDTLAPAPSTPSPQLSRAVPDITHEEEGHEEEFAQSINQAEVLELPTLRESETPASQLSSQPLGEVERHPKGKRKRTTAKDKAILEGAYNANPKPDKAARQDIVNRVSLNEKEVQIWFQNRRQNDRRKSRPLSPQEIAALRYGGMQILSSDNTLPVYTSEPEHTSPVQAVSSLEQEYSSPPRGIASPSRLDRHETEQNHEDTSQEDTLLLTEPQSQPQEERESTALPVFATPAQKQRHAGDDDSLLMSQHLPSSVGYLSNRWNHPAHSHCLSTPISFNRADDSFNNFPPSSCSSSTSALRPRLSTGLDGKADVVTSPPQNPASLPPPELQSFDSACRPSYQRGPSESPVTLPPISTITNSLSSSQSAGPLLPRLTRGRSRDVHAWEFACDAENREDALTVQANNESRGSAIAAISLLRSTSLSTAGGGSPLQPSRSNKRNASISGMTPRADSSTKKPRLTKGLSATARLETPNNNIWAGKRQSFAADTPAGFSYNTKPKSSALFISPQGNESDKENWSPDENGNPRFSYHQPSSAIRPTNRRLLPSGPLSSSTYEKTVATNPRRTPAHHALIESSPSFLLSGNRANTAPLYGGGRGQYHRGGGGGGDKRDGGASELRIYEDFGTPNHNNHSPTASRRAPPPPFEDDGMDEVERFMRGEVSPSKKGDADAVAGLLSLSQGNWR